MDSFYGNLLITKGVKKMLELLRKILEKKTKKSQDFCYNPNRIIAFRFSENDSKIEVIRENKKDKKS